jgi:hypothetical protein
MFKCHNIALVSQAAQIDASGLARVGAALQKQVMSDLAPVWEVTATVDTFPSLEEVPVGYWAIIITLRDLAGDLIGLHYDDAGQPVAYVEWSDSWSITASHECLEMLVDPWGSRLINAPALPGDVGHMRYLVEVCDPCQHARNAYAVNDTLVSDFYTPSYFDHTGRSGARYSLTGAITAPRQILPGGYLSWNDTTTGHWWQSNGEGKTDLGLLSGIGGCMRQQIDAKTEDHLGPTRLPKAQVQERVGFARARAREASQGRALRLARTLKQSDPTDATQPSLDR